MVVFERDAEVLRDTRIKNKTPNFYYFQHQHTTTMQKPIKSNLHPNNINREAYDLEALIKIKPELQSFIQPNKFGNLSINFAKPKAVKLLNQALLQHYYGIEHWDFPDANLCPPIPGRADYLHYLADLLNRDEINSQTITCLDIGTGATCIYPILGVAAFDWNFIASDIDQFSIKNAQTIIDSNASLKDKIELRHQPDKQHIFSNIIQPSDKIDATICNPPFHASKAAAIKGNQRKVKNLRLQKRSKTNLNFAGNLNELVYEGGELQFIKTMIEESVLFQSNCKWFTTLVSKEQNLKPIYRFLKAVKPKAIKTIDMGTGNKKSRFVAWKF